jgi:arsenite-transporting ATPase
VVGDQMLTRMAKAIYGDRDPADRFYEGSPQRVQKNGSEYLLALKVPFISKDAIDLTRHDSELYVTVGSYRREIALPRVLAQRKTVGATVEGDELIVRFAK